MQFLGPASQFIGSLVVPAKSAAVNDQEAANTNHVKGAIANAAETGATILAKLLTVDVDGSGLNATSLQSTTPGVIGLAMLAAGSRPASQTALGIRAIAPSGLTLADDAIGAYNGTSIPGMINGGFMLVCGDSIAAGYALCYVRCGGTASAIALLVGSAAPVVQVQTATTGTVAGITDGNLGIAMGTNDVLRLINRTGASRFYNFFFLPAG